MKAAFPYWENRIAPVLDTAYQVLVVEAECGQIVSETQEMLPEDPPVQKALRLVGLGIDAVVCGAVSRPMHALVDAYGIQVIPFVAGDLREVMDAWLRGTLTWNAFGMPGCSDRGARVFSGMRDSTHEEDSMKRRHRGMGGAGGKGRGQGGRGGGGVGGSAAVGSTGDCVCPQCGNREAHERGVPCVKRQCAKCGTFMTKE